jgi:hypothetical protein
MTLSQFATTLTVLGIVLAGFGFVVASALVMAVGALLFSWGYALQDYLDPRRDSITPMTAYTLIIGNWQAGSHILACLLAGSRYHYILYAFSADDYLVEAQALSSLYLIIPPLVYRAVANSPPDTALGAIRLPAVGLPLSDSATLWYCMSMALASFSLRILGIYVTSLGSLGFLIRMGPEIAIFILSFHWLGPRPTMPPWTRFALAGMILFEVGYSFLFSTMRGDMAYPLYSFLLAAIVRKALRGPVLAVGIAAVVGLVLVYHPLGHFRNRYFGQERVQKLLETLEGAPDDFNAQGPPLEDEEDLRNAGFDVKVLTLVARGCQFGQLSQVARIADQEGYYFGETLKYVFYAMIPRVIWRDKPLITPGGWFAFKIGKARRLSENLYSNSINMTLVGEFYLNFGWIGAVVGLVLLGTLFAVVWRSTLLYEFSNNPIGQTLAMAVFFQSVSSSSAASLLNLLFMYFSTLAATFACSFLVPVPVPAAEDDVAPRPRAQPLPRNGLPKPVAGGPARRNGPRPSAAE